MKGHEGDALASLLSSIIRALILGMAFNKGKSVARECSGEFDRDVLERIDAPSAIPFPASLRLIFYYY